MSTSSCRAGFALWIVTAGLSLATPAFADYTVTGKFQYGDREFGTNGFTGTVSPRPIRFADVRIVAGVTELAKGATTEDGSFSITVPGSTAQSITAICVTSSTQTPGVMLDVRVANDDFSFGDFYSVASLTANASGSGTVNMGTTLAAQDIDAGKAFNIWDVAIDALQFVASPGVAGRLPTQKLTAIWRFSHWRAGAFFSRSGDSRYIYIGFGSACDDTVISHEFGHYIDDLYSKSENPGGSHIIGDGKQDIRLSWAEGLATFLGSSARKFKGYPRPEIYVSTDGINLSFSYELEYLSDLRDAFGSRGPASITGSTNEISVSAALWDIIDGPSTADSTPGMDDDPLERPFSDVWKVLTMYIPSVSRPGISIETFWDGWFSPAVNNGFLGEMQITFSNVNGIEFIPDAFEPDDAAGSARNLTPQRQPDLANGAKVIINELDLGNTDAVELYNAGNAAADIGGWTIETTFPGRYPGTVDTSTFPIPPFKLEPGALLVITEASGTNTNSTIYAGSNIFSWANGWDGSCALQDGSGQGVDFVRWGTSRESAPNGTSFTGPNPPSPAPDNNLCRNFAGDDTDSGGDWTAQATTLGTYNGLFARHTHYPAGDLDYAFFSATAGRSYLAETAALSSGADTIIDIIDGNGSTVLASNDDFGGTKWSRLVWTAPSTGKYFLRCQRFSGASNLARYGSYGLRIVESATGFSIGGPQTLTVSKPGLGGKYQRLSDALAAASSGDTIQILDGGTYEESPSISGKSITLKAVSGKNPVLDGRDSTTLATLNIYNAKTFRIDGLTIRGGSRGIRISNSNLTIVNSVITGASDPSGFSDGLQVVGPEGSLNAVNCTIVNNARYGVGVFSNASARMTNCIFQNNSSGDIDGDGTAINVAVKNSLTGSGEYAGAIGNRGGDPQFVDAANKNFRLKPTSPAIDAGDPTNPDLPDSDADGIPRSIDGKGSGKAIPDMGAYEYLPLNALTSTAVFPQIAVGGSGHVYRTSIVGINTGAVAAMANLSLTKSDATPLPITVLNALETAQNSASRPQNATRVFAKDGSSFNVSIPPSGTVRLEAAAAGGTVAGYAKLMSNVPLNGMAVFKSVSGQTILSEAGVGLSKPTKTFTLYIDNLNGAISGYAVANFGSSPASLTLTLRDKSGIPKAEERFTLPPGQHIAEFAFQRFKTAAPAGFEGTIEFTSDQNVAAVALRFDNPASDVFSTIPVLIDQASTTLYFPQAADGGGYRTNFMVINPSTTAGITAKLEFFAGDGSPMSFPIAGVARTSFEIPLGAKGVGRMITDGTSASVKAGWVRVTCPVAIGGSAIFQTTSGTQIMSEAGVASSPLALHFAAYVESYRGVTHSGLAICNPNAGVVGITLNLRNSSGQVVATTSFSLPPLGHTARIFNGANGWFPNGFEDHEGTLEVLATGSVSAVALRYDNEPQNVFATLPVIVVP